MRLGDFDALKEDFADMRDGQPIFSDSEMLSTKEIAKIIDMAPSVDAKYIRIKELDKLSSCLRQYLNDDKLAAINGYDDTFYDGVLWAFARLAEIYPSED